MNFEESHRTDWVFEIFTSNTSLQRHAMINIHIFTKSPDKSLKELNIDPLQFIKKTLFTFSEESRFPVVHFDVWFVEITYYNDSRVYVYLASLLGPRTRLGVQDHSNIKKKK